MGGAQEEVEDREGEGKVDEDDEDVADNRDCVDDTEGTPCQFMSDGVTSRGGKSWGAIARCWECERVCTCDGVSIQGELRSEVEDAAEDPDEDREWREVSTAQFGTPLSNENPLNNSGSTSGNGDSSLWTWGWAFTFIDVHSNPVKSMLVKAVVLPVKALLANVHDFLNAGWALKDRRWPNVLCWCWREILLIGDEGLVWEMNGTLGNAIALISSAWACGAE